MARQGGPDPGAHLRCVRSGNRKPDARKTACGSADTVDIETPTYTNAIGAARLATVSERILIRSGSTRLLLHPCSRNSDAATIPPTTQWASVSTSVKPGSRQPSRKGRAPSADLVHAYAGPLSGVRDAWETRSSRAAVALSRRGWDSARDLSPFPSGRNGCVARTRPS